MTLRRVSYVVEALVGIAAVATIVLLFTNDPTSPEPAPAEAVAASGGHDGAALYGANCARCHGGDGSGGIGPRLAGRVVEVFPDAAAQISVVADGRGGMPAFAGRLSDDEIVAIVEYTRTVMAGS